MRSKLGFVASATVLAVAPIAQAQPVDQQRFLPTILFPSPNIDGSPYTAGWVILPSRAEVRAAVPAGVEVEGRTNWACHVAVSGALKDCAMQTDWPHDARYEEAGRALMPKFRLSAEAAADAQRNDARVVFNIYFSGPGLKPADMSSCPPLFCTPVLKPPPLPAPPPPPKD